MRAVSRAVCPGSFDPATSGHLDVIERTARLFDDVVVAVGNNMAKNALFSPAERVDMLAEACSPWDNVTVALFDGLLVDFCTIHRIAAIVKGLADVRVGDQWRGRHSVLSQPLAIPSGYSDSR